MVEIAGKTSEGMYLDKPIRTFDGTYMAASHRLPGQEFPVSVHLAIHPNLSRRIIVNIPGTSGEIDGYAEKYKKLAYHIQSKGLAAVVRTGNDFTDLPQDIRLISTLEYTKQHAWEICGEPKPEIFLMGFSAGASAIATRAYRHPQVSRILLCAPSTDLSGINVRNGLRQFRGEVYIVIGDNDENVGTESGQILYDEATNASHKKLFVIPECDHQFRGEKKWKNYKPSALLCIWERREASFSRCKRGNKTVRLRI